MNDAQYFSIYDEYCNCNGDSDREKFLSTLTPKTLSEFLAEIKKRNSIKGKFLLKVKIFIKLYYVRIVIIFMILSIIIVNIITRI